MGNIISGHERLRLGQRGRTAITLGLTVDEMAFGIEMVGNGCMDRGEFL